MPPAVRLPLREIFVWPEGPPFFKTVSGHLIAPTQQQQRAGFNHQLASPLLVFSHGQRQGISSIKNDTAILYRYMLAKGFFNISGLVSLAQELFFR